MLCVQRLRRDLTPEFERRSRWIGLSDALVRLLIVLLRRVHLLSGEAQGGSLSVSQTAISREPRLPESQDRFLTIQPFPNRIDCGFATEKLRQALQGERTSGCHLGQWLTYLAHDTGAQLQEVERLDVVIVVQALSHLLVLSHVRALSLRAEASTSVRLLRFDGSWTQGTERGVSVIPGSSEAANFASATGLKFIPQCGACRLFLKRTPWISCCPHVRSCSGLGLLTHRDRVLRCCLGQSLRRAATAELRL